MGIKIVLADDNSLTRESFKIMLSHDEHIEIMKTFDDGMDVIEYCTREIVDIALLDVRMPRVNGIQATREIVKRSNTKVIILTSLQEDEYIVEAIKCGAKGYILKNSNFNMILDTIKAIYTEDSINRNEAIQMKNVCSKKVLIDENRIRSFTRNEMKIVKEVASGLTNKEISKRLFISEESVKRYINSILSKAGFENRIQIAMYYLKGRAM